MSARKLSIDSRMTFISFGGPLGAALARGAADATTGADEAPLATDVALGPTVAAPGASVGEFFEQAGATAASARLTAQTAVRFIPLPSQGGALFGKFFCGDY